MYFEDIQIGDQILIPERLVEEEEMMDFNRRYDGASMHVDPIFAAQSRIGRVTAAGFYTFLLMWGFYAPRNFGQEQEIAGTFCNMEFKAPVFAGDRIHGTVTVIDKKERNPYNGSYRVRLEVFNQDDQLVLVSESDDIVKRKPI